MTSFKRLGVFASAEEMAFVKHCANMPVMGMTNPEPPGPGVSPVVNMFTTPIEAAHKAALAHDLPEFDGYYGIDLSNGEFLKPE